MIISVQIATNYNHVKLHNYFIIYSWNYKTVSVLNHLHALYMHLELFWQL